MAWAVAPCTCPSTIIGLINAAVVDGCVVDEVDDTRLRIDLDDRGVDLRRVRERELSCFSPCPPCRSTAGRRTGGSGSG